MAGGESKRCTCWDRSMRILQTHASKHKNDDKVHKTMRRNKTIRPHSDKVRTAAEETSGMKKTSTRNLYENEPTNATPYIFTPTEQENTWETKNVRSTGDNNKTDISGPTNEGSANHDSTTKNTRAPQEAQGRTKKTFHSRRIHDGRTKTSYVSY